MRVYYIDHPVIGQLALTAEEMSVIVDTTGLDLTMAAEFITGISEDDYADAFADTVEQYYEDEGDVSSVQRLLVVKRVSDRFATCEAFHRIMNLDRTDAQVTEALLIDIESQCDG